MSLAMQNLSSSMTELFRDCRVAVYTNGSGEIFVESLIDGGMARVSPYGTGLLVTAASDTILPWMSNGLPAFKIKNLK